jgi:hypothetical protein
MTTFLEFSTWAWIAGVFVVIKCIFKHLFLASQGFASAELTVKSLSLSVTQLT